MKDAQALVIKRASQQARDIRSFDMMLEDVSEADALSLSFIPGQVAVLRVGNEQAYFAFASAPEDAELEFLVKRGYGAGGAIYEMKEGDRVELLNIVGHGFALREHKGSDLVFVAMGTGVAPLR